MELLGILLLLLVLTRSFGEFANRLGQPPLLGELIAGIALGRSLTPSLIPFPFCEICRKILCSWRSPTSASSS